MELTADLIWGIIISIEITAAVTVGIAFGNYLWRLRTERSRGAKERCKIVYDDFLIKKITKVIEEVEEIKPFYFHLEFEEEIKSLLLKSTKNCLDKLGKISEDYTDMRDIATDRLREKLERLLRDSYKNVREKEQEKKILSYLGEGEDIVKCLSKHFHNLEHDILRAKVKGDEISFDWFKRLQLYETHDRKAKLNEMLRDAGKSLESFFQELNSWLNKEASIRFLKEYQEKYLNEAKNTKEKLEKDAKKLKFKRGFVYGIGDEQVLQDLKEKIPEESSERRFI
ncbi:MAG: hypothetical protein U9N41_03010 [Euryarchaeota archaeon]|nr:hypothetical protein [Euryarchaeota archaeon]